MGEVISFQSRLTIEAADSSPGAELYSSNPLTGQIEDLIEQLKQEAVEELEDVVILINRKDGSFSIASTPLTNAEAYYLFGIAQQSAI